MCHSSANPRCHSANPSPMCRSNTNAYGKPRPICQSNEPSILDYSANPMQIPERSQNLSQICQFKTNPRPISDQSSLNPPKIVQSQVLPPHLAQYQQRTLKLSTLAPIGCGLSQVMPILGQSMTNPPIQCQSANPSPITNHMPIHH